MKEYLTENLQQKVKYLFSILDEDGSMTLEKTEVITRFELNNRNKEEAERFFRIFDLDQSGVVTYDEFLEFWLHLRSKSSEIQVI